MFNLTAVGRLTAAPELSHTPGGTALCKMSIATSRYAGKEKGTVTDYLDITVWGPIAVTHSEQLGKGHQICATGDLIQERWEQDGQTRRRHVLNAQDVEYLSKPKGATDNAPAGEPEMAEPF